MENAKSEITHGHERLMKVRNTLDLDAKDPVICWRLENRVEKHCWLVQPVVSLSFKSQAMKVWNIDTRICEQVLGGHLDDGPKAPDEKKNGLRALAALLMIFGAFALIRYNH